MIILQLLPILCLLLFIFLQSVSIKIETKDRLTVNINFNILAITLKEDEIKKRRITNIFKKMKVIPPIYKVLKLLISKSEVTVVRYIYCESHEDTGEEINHARGSTALVIFSSYLKSVSKSFSYIEKKVFIDKDDTESTSYFDLYLHVSFLNMIISALIFLYYIVKNKVKEVIKNV